MAEFYEATPTLDNYWRSIVLFGRNVASYKFALAKSLLEFQDRGDDLIRLDELAGPHELCALPVVVVACLLLHGADALHHSVNHLVENVELE